MATVFSHALVGASLVRMAPASIRTRAVYFLGAGTAMLPDADYLGYASQVPYESLWGHRGMTHSILFAAATGAVLALCLRRSQMPRSQMSVSENGIYITRTGTVAGLLFLTSLSHGILDAMTNGGLGIAFFSPFEQSRYFFPWTPIQVSPMGRSFFSDRGIAVLVSEARWIALPCFAFLGIVRLLKKPRGER